MVGRVFSCSFTGLQCRIIEVQADISNGLPSFSIVGLGDASVQESRERVRSSIKNSDASFPSTKKVVNLAPAQVKKQGSLFDLSIAMSLLIAGGQITDEKLKDSIIIGELSLTGKIKRVNGVLPITQHAKEQGFKRIFLPKENADEASFIEGVEILPVTNLKELIEYCSGTKELEPKPNSRLKKEGIKSIDANSYANIVGLEQAKRGLLISAAGGHNTLFYGSPGCGKTLICRTIKSLFPEMSKEEMLETTKIFSVAGLLDNDNPIIKKRPFREVHHTASLASVVGGGTFPRPGEISLAHNGILFLDEIAEFSRHVLESLRQPLEDKFININRINSSLKFPSNFILLATMNPCPCGYKGDKSVPCICTETQIHNYQKKISGPLLDRFDLFIEVAKTPMGTIFTHKVDEEKCKEIIISIKNAKSAQCERFKKHPKIRKNSDMTLEEIRQHCKLEKNVRDLLEKASRQLSLSNRGYLKTIKIARTIADLAQSPKIQLHHIAEAIQYRRKR